MKKFSGGSLGSTLKYKLPAPACPEKLSPYDKKSMVPGQALSNYFLFSTTRYRSPVEKKREIVGDQTSQELIWHKP